MTDPFDTPADAGGDRLNLNDNLGALLLFTVHSIEHDIETAFGQSDAIKCDVANIDTTDTYTNTLIFPRVLQSQLGSKVGGMVLGRLAQGEAKKGQSPPWILDDPTDPDKQKARDYIAANRAKSDPF